MKKSCELFRRALDVIPGGVNSPVRAFRSVRGISFFYEKGGGSDLDHRGWTGAGRFRIFLGTGDTRSQPSPHQDSHQ